MPRKFFRRVSIRYPRNRPPAYLRPFRELLKHHAYFAVSRRSVTGALWIGLFIGFLPIPGQVAIAVLAALLMGVNLPIAAIGVWVSNPVTFFPIFYFEYRLGALILDIPVRQVNIEMSWHWLTTGLLSIWKPLLLGSLVTATVVASAAYIFVNLLWRRSTIARYRRRRLHVGRRPRS